MMILPKQPPPGPLLTKEGPREVTPAGVMLKRSVPVFLIVLTLVVRASAEEPSMHAGTLAHALDRVATTGRVLYVGAHPDDENTRLLAYLANHRHLTAAYL